jgi:hypothetical protein
MRGSRADTADVDPIGSEGWARSWRAEVQRMLVEQPRAQRLELYAKLGARWRVWALLLRRDGGHFRSLEELCREPRPYGLGCTSADLKASRTAPPPEPARPPVAKAAATTRVARAAAKPATSAARPAARAARPRASKRPRKPGKKVLAVATARGLPETVQRRLKLLRRDVAEALARGEFVSVDAASRAGKGRRGPDPVAKILASVKKLAKLDRVRLGLALVELGLFAKR